MKRFIFCIIVLKEPKNFKKISIFILNIIQKVSNKRQLYFNHALGVLVGAGEEAGAAGVLAGAGVEEAVVAAVLSAAEVLAGAGVVAFAAYAFFKFC